MKVIRSASALLVASGLSVLVYLNASDWWAQYQAECHITEFSSVYSDENDPERLEYLRQAQMHNSMIAGQVVSPDLLPYEKQLFYRHEPMMSYIEIPKIAVKLPIYHGTAESELMSGIGHLESSSLPVGGPSSHCVLTGHSGMRNARMFDDLHKLRPGDEFVIWTLNEPYAYRVRDIETVLPEEAGDKLGVIEGHDLVTLVTCTPYGVNSHRLLVHAERCAYEGGEALSSGFETYVNDRNLPLLAALGVFGVSASVMGARSVSRWRKRRRPSSPAR